MRLITMLAWASVLLATGPTLLLPVPAFALDKTVKKTLTDKKSSAVVANKAALKLNNSRNKELTSTINTSQNKIAKLQDKFKRDSDRYFKLKKKNDESPTPDGTASVKQLKDAIDVVSVELALEKKANNLAMGKAQAAAKERRLLKAERDVLKKESLEAFATRKNIPVVPSGVTLVYPAAGATPVYASAGVAFAYPAGTSTTPAQAWGYPSFKPLADGPPPKPPRGDVKKMQDIQNARANAAQEPPMPVFPTLAGLPPLGPLSQAAAAVTRPGYGSAKSASQYQELVLAPQ